MKLSTIIESAQEVLNTEDPVILKRCANLVLGYIATNHRECVATQTFHVTNGKIKYNRFNKNFLGVKSVKIDGRVVAHTLYMDYIATPNGVVTVEYRYVPVFKNDNQKIVIEGISEQCMVYGVLTEYAVICGMLNEAKVWAEKYETELFNNNPKYKNLRLPRG